MNESKISNSENTSSSTERQANKSKTKQAAIKNSTITSMKTKQTIFLWLFLLLPMIQFIIFYFGVNFRSILLAFQTYDLELTTFKFTGFEKFGDVLADFFVNKSLLPALGNSLKMFLVTIISIPLHVVVAYAIFRKIPFSNIVFINNQDTK